MHQISTRIPPVTGLRPHQLRIGASFSSPARQACITTKFVEYPPRLWRASFDPAFIVKPQWHASGRFPQRSPLTQAPTPLRRQGRQGGRMERIGLYQCTMLLRLRSTTGLTCSLRTLPLRTCLGATTLRQRRLVILVRVACHPSSSAQPCRPPRGAEATESGANLLSSTARPPSSATPSAP